MNVFLINENRDEVGIFGDALKKVNGSIVFGFALDEADAMKYLVTQASKLPDAIFINEKHLLFLENLRKHQQFVHLRVILYTNSTDPDHIERALSLNASLFPKPNSYRELSVLLKRRFDRLLVQNN